jgi:uncharacterized membrane protein (DUF485 family)
MSALTDIVCTVADLVQSAVKYEAKSLLLTIEEQKKSLECCLKKMRIWCGLLTLIMLVLLAGIGLIIAGAYILLASVTGAGVSALIIGVIVTLLAAILIMTVHNSLR